MNVHFIDTSVLLELLNVPGKSKNPKHYRHELLELKKSRSETLILPFATIIETSNHIAQNGDGNQRRECAKRFCDCIQKTITGEAPWKYYGKQMSPEDLEIICRQFPDAAMREEGFGDLSIIRAYEKYKKETPGIAHIRIWTSDTHLIGYDEDVPMTSRRNG